MIITKTPFRLTLGGGGTDLPSYYREHGGYVLTSAIDKYMYICIKYPGSPVDNKIILKYSKSEVVSTPDELEHDIVRAVLKTEGITGSIQISSIADCPAGSGLGSSGSYTVGLLNGIYFALERSIDKKTLAEDACAYEMNILKKPSGKQDQYIASYGGIIEMIINKTGCVTVNRVPIENYTIKTLESNMMMFYTGFTRKAESILQTQKEKIDSGEIIDIMHSIKEIGMNAKNYLVAGDCHKFAHTLDLHWQLKSKISKDMSSEYIDKWYKHALNCGAIGGKLCGAGGGGGFINIYCDDENACKRIRKDYKEYGMIEMPWRFEMNGTRIVADI